MDFEEKDRQTKNMKQEYARLKTDMEEKSKKAVSQHLEKLSYAVSQPAFGPVLRHEGLCGIGNLAQSHC